MKITSLRHAEELLQTYVPGVASYSGDGMTLQRMWPLLAAAGNPHKKLRTIHIAGTSGKTSTAYYIASLLTAAGKKTGLTVSPHVDSITERVQIDTVPLRDDVFCQYLGEFLELIEGAAPKPSYFELMIVFIYWVFVELEVDYAVVETGMGGLLDGTNVIERPDKVCVITDIGFDHMHILGATLAEISTQKAGIIQQGNDVYMYQQADEIMQPINDRVDKSQAKLHLAPSVDFAKNHMEKAAQLPQFQQRNFGLAWTVCSAVAARGEFDLRPIDPLEVIVPGRLEMMHSESGVIVMDGAHNRQKAEAFAASFSALFPGQKADVLIALKKGKEYVEVINVLQPLMESCIVTTFQTSQDLPAVAQDPEVIAQYVQEQGVDVAVQEDFVQAYQSLLSRPASAKLVIGSFYLLGQLRSTLK